MTLREAVERVERSRAWHEAVADVKDRLLDAEHVGVHAMAQVMVDLGTELLAGMDGEAPS